MTRRFRIDLEVARTFDPATPLGRLAAQVYAGQHLNDTLTNDIAWVLRDRDRLEREVHELRMQLEHPEGEQMELGLLSLARRGVRRLRQVTDGWREVRRAG